MLRVKLKKKGESMTNICIIKNLIQGKYVEKGTETASTCLYTLCQGGDGMGTIIYPYSVVTCGIGMN